MFKYSVHMFCDECGTPHPMHIGVELAEELSPGQNIADIYDGREMPAQLATLRNNQTVCPRTGRVILQRENRHIFLVRIA